MKKHFITLFSLLLVLSAHTLGCGKEEPETAAIPDTVVVETQPVTEDVPSPEEEPPLTEEPAVSEETPSNEELITDNETAYPYWWELHDYNLDQELLVADGEIKNLSIQLGNNPDELYITWFSKSDSR